MTMRKRAAQLDREIREALAQPHDHLVYRSVGSDGDPWPDWLLATRNSCGVYAIRSKTGEPLYVGSSHKRLYGTVSRHFQTWGRTPKGRKRIKFSRPHITEHDPGIVYQRGRCEVGIRVMQCGAGKYDRPELEEETNLIYRLRPRDNLVDHPDGELEPAPF